MFAVLKMVLDLQVAHSLASSTPPFVDARARVAQEDLFAQERAKWAEEGHGSWAVRGFVGPGTRNTWLSVWS